jgi:two-component system chemotaxis response regulator CheY
MSYRVLIVDDAGFVRELLSQACEALGYVVIGEASNGQQAIDLTFQMKPDIVIMDLVMPQFNGIEATERILDIMPDIDIIACSSLDDEETLLLAMKKGCRAFLRKPFTRQSLTSVFKQIESQKRGIKHA